MHIVNPDLTHFDYALQCEVCHTMALASYNEVQHWSTFLMNTTRIGTDRMITFSCPSCGIKNSIQESMIKIPK